MTSNWAGTALPFASSSTALPGSFNAPCGKGMPVVTGQFVRETPEGSFSSRPVIGRIGSAIAEMVKAMQKANITVVALFICISPHT
jgi:hypothetical protein